MEFYETNSDEMKYELEMNREYFDNMFKGVDDTIVLDEQQRIAVLLNADNLLVVAGAGSGKTTTMVAKVKYLIDKCAYQETDIVVLSFTRKVKEELQKIINEQFGFKNVTISTFHSLGLNIIKHSGENYNGIVDENGQYMILADYIKNVLFNDKEKFYKLVNSFGKSLFFSDDWKKYNNFDEYHNATYNNLMKENNFDLEGYNLYQISRRREFKKTIRGEYLRSKEEVDIANILYRNGIDYEYEKKYDKDSKIKWYHPDFYIKQGENQNYIEHFGVDEAGYNDMYTKDELNSYLKNLKLKQEFFNSGYNRDLFIVTYSKYNDGSTYISHLKDELSRKNYTPIKKSEEEIYETLKNTSKDMYYYKFVDKIAIPFISLFKQQGYTLKDFDELGETVIGGLNDQLEVLKEFFMYYQNQLDEQKVIDFEDMIYKTYKTMPLIKEHNLGVDYKYLIIDEYQDISKNRLDLVRRISDLFDAKVMAVGDDWQTIFGYSGSRIDLFQNFEYEMENAKSVPIEHTYRNSQELIDIAGKFILKNEMQIQKRLLSNKYLKNPVEILIYDDTNRDQLDINRSLIVQKVLDHINSINPRSKVLLMGRYKSDVYKITNDDLFKIYGEKVISKIHPKMHIDFLTIHKAKGLGYDYCILLDLLDGTYGFPSKIEDAAVIKLITPRINEPIDYPEERRLFYVALTRTKNKIYILVPNTRASSFAVELIKYDNVRLSAINNTATKVTK